MKAQIKRVNGALKVDIDGRIYDPLSFKSFRANSGNVSEFYDAGVRLFSVLIGGITSALGVPYSLYGESWIGENEYDFSVIDRQMDMFIENAPDAYFAPMIQLDTREWYLKLHPEVPNSFTHLSQIAHDEEWRKAAADYMKAAINHCEEKYGEHIYGYFLLCGTTTEWFSDHDYEASHPIKEAGFRKWTGDKNAVLPSIERLNADGDVFLSEDEEDVYIARKFHAETIADLILYFTGEAQSIIRHNKLLGLYYGYLFELKGERLYNAGSLAYEKVFKSPDIDMISSPSSYSYRGISDPSAFMLTQKTLDAHNKLYFLEFDHITHVAPEQIKEGLDESASNRKIVRIPGAKNKCKSESESMNLMYRDFILCNANMAALWWFDMFDGWFRSEGMMNAVKHMIGISKRLSEKYMESAAEIAVFAEGESMYRVRKSAKITNECLSDIRRTLAECGAAYDLYSIMDISLPKMDGYKLYIFVNQYDMTDETREIIAERFRKAGKTILWLYASGRCMTNVSYRESDTSHGGIVYDGNVTTYNVKAPYFSIDDADANILAYFEDGTPAAAYKDIGGYKEVRVCTCNLPSSLLRDISKLAGVHEYSDRNNVYVYANSASIGVYNASEDDAEVRLKEDGEYLDLIGGERYLCKQGFLSLPKQEINAYLLIKD